MIGNVWSVNNLHREDREEFVMSAIRAFGSFLIHEERL
jgi:hypothetical protein